MIPGRATEQGTARFAQRFAGKVAEDHFRKIRDLHLSSLGLGTYLGNPDEGDDESYEQAVRAVLAGGCNVIDTAVNYRFQRSERNIGAALAALVAEGALSRDEVVVATKGGFFSFDGGYPRDPGAWVRETFVDTGIVSPGDIAAGCHCMSPAYIEHQIETSRKNLGLRTIDIYYVHNPETQLGEMDRKTFLGRLRDCFEALERQVAAGSLAMYGTATWDGYRRKPGEPGHLSLAEVLDAARRAALATGSDEHHFGAIQLPLNLAMPEGLLAPTQIHPLSEGAPLPLLPAASAAGLVVMASASMLQGHLVARMPPELSARIPGGSSPAHKALQWTRSAPGLATALVGMRSPAHIRENLAVAGFPRMTREEFKAFLEPHH